MVQKQRAVQNNAATMDLLELLFRGYAFAGNFKTPEGHRWAELGDFQNALFS